MARPPRATPAPSPAEPRGPRASTRPPGRRSPPQRLTLASSSGRRWGSTGTTPRGRRSSGFKKNDRPLIFSLARLPRVTILRDMKTTRYMAKCKACNCVTSTLATHEGHGFFDMGAMFYDEKGESGVFGNLVIRCRKCSKARRAVSVRGKFSAKHECNAKCLASTGPTCECSCGGKNHGASYAA